MKKIALAILSLSLAGLSFGQTPAPAAAPMAAPTTKAKKAKKVKKSKVKAEKPAAGMTPAAK